MKILALILLVISFAFGSLTDDAYKAYKAKEYKKAFELYSKAYQYGSKKAAYNLAVFYQKGIGAKKDKQKAVKLYKELTNRLNYRIDDEYCFSKMAKYYKIALKNLAKLEPSSNAKKLLKKLNKSCYNKVYLLSNKSILLKKYPKNVRKIFYYKRLYLQAKVEDNREKEKIYKNKIISFAKPLMRYYLQKSIKCIKKAKIYKDIQSCSYDRVRDFDSLFGEENVSGMMGAYADALHFYSTKEEQDAYYNAMKDKVTKKDKEKFIKEIQKLIKNCNPKKCMDFVYAM